MSNPGGAHQHQDSGPSTSAPHGQAGPVPEMTQNRTQTNTQGRGNDVEKSSQSGTGTNTTRMYEADTELLRGVAPGAQVWATYVQETKAYDNELVEKWNRSLDVTLVFAALFSAIVTAFILESVKLLQPDPSQVTMDTLVDISQVLRTIAAGQPLILEKPNTSDRTGFRPSVYSIWINILFFLSLSLSIAASLVAMLAKQWCYNFLSGRTGDAIDQVEMRQEMFNAIEKWNMGGVLEMMPVLMHVSVGFFWAGLVLYLWDINIAVAVVVTILAGTTASFYFGTMLLSASVKNCPFTTPQVGWVRHGIKRLGTLIPVNDPNNLRNGSNSIGLIARIIHRFSVSTQSNILPSEQPLDTSVSAPKGHSSTRDTEHPAFILEALSWLITHSRDSNTISTAIGAWAVARPGVEGTSRKASVGLKQHIKSFLVGHFSACFSTSPEFGVKLSLLDDDAHFSLALDYSRWMTYFANSSLGGIEAELKGLLHTNTFEQFVHLGLAFASLAESRRLSCRDAKNVVMWLSAFISVYPKDMKTLPTDRALAAMIDGITVAGLNLAESGDPEERQQIASNLGIPYLVRSLSDIDPKKSEKLQLRSSIVLSLAVFALRAKFAYPFDPDGAGFDAQANQLVDDYQSGDLSLGGEGYAPFLIFSLVGLIHPKSKLDLDKETTRKICNLIQKTDFFSRSLCDTKAIHQITGHRSFRHHMTQMLMEAIIPTDDRCKMPIHIGQENKRYLSLFLREAEADNWTEPPPSARFWTIDGGRVFPSLLEATCHLLHDHYEGRAKLYPGVLVAATELLCREVKHPEEIDIYVVMNNGEPTNSETSAPSRTTQLPSSEESSRLANLVNQTLKLVMANATDSRCFKAVIRTCLRSPERQSVGSAMKLIRGFADNHCASYPPHPTLEGKKSDDNEVQTPEKKERDTDQTYLLRLSGYSRLLASVIRNSSDPRKLLEELKDNASKGGEGKTWRCRLREIRKVFVRLADTKVDAKVDTQVVAFAVAGLAAWELCTPSISQINEGSSDSELAEKDPPPTSWDILEKYSVDRNELPSEAVEALLDTPVWLAATSPEVPKMEPRHAHIILVLIARVRSRPGARLRTALAVAVTFWGLSLDQPGWRFWTAKDRGAYWEQYMNMNERKKDSTALLLIGLSRILFHYSTLQLSHESIKTIAHEIHNHMSTHSGGSCNLALDFLSPGLTFDVRRHVRESVWDYLKNTEGYPFTRSTNDVRELLRNAVAYDGGEGYAYEAPQPFVPATTPEELDEAASE